MRRALFVSLTACLGLLVAAGLAGSLAESTPAASKAITPSPIYTAAQLGAPAGDDWLMHMGNLKGHRYSSLTQISKANVGTLKLAWKVDLGYCTTNNAACGSFEANAVVARRHLLHPGPVRRRLRARRRDGRQALEVDAHLRRRLRPRLGLEEARRRDRRGQGLRRPGRRPALRRSIRDGQRALVDGSDAVEDRRQDLERSDLRQRHGSHRRLRRRQRRLQRHDAGLHGEQRQAHLVLGRDPDRRASPATRRGPRTPPATPTTARTAAARCGSHRSSTRSSTSRSSARATRCRGTAAARDEPLHRLDRRAQPLHGSAGLVLPDDPPRPVGRRPAEQRRHVHGEVQDQGQDGHRVPASPTSTSTG